MIFFGFTTTLFWWFRWNSTDNSKILTAILGKTGRYHDTKKIRGKTIWNETRIVENRSWKWEKCSKLKVPRSTLFCYLFDGKTCSIQWKIDLSAKLFMEAGSEFFRKRQNSVEHFNYHFHKTNDFMFIVFLQISSKLKGSLKS